MCGPADDTFGYSEEVLTFVSRETKAAYAKLWDSMYADRWPRNTSGLAGMIDPATLVETPSPHESTLERVERIRREAREASQLGLSRRRLPDMHRQR